MRSPARKERSPAFSPAKSYIATTNSGLGDGLGFGGGGGGGLFCFAGSLAETESGRFPRVAVEEPEVTDEGDGLL